MRKRNIAAVLSFVVPGFGLLYLHRPKSAVANLLLAIVVPIVASLLIPIEHLHYALLAVAAGSAGYAHAAGSRYTSADAAPKAPAQSA